jgi:hypothetical protein
MKIGRNDSCPCGSGTKYKKCCGASNAIRTTTATRESIDTSQRSEAREQIRIEQQGQGKPIISAEQNGARVVVAGDTVYSSKKWRVFPDFLSDYIKNILDPEWGNSEIRKPFDQRHPILQWYDVCSRQMTKLPKDEHGLIVFSASGAIRCYLGLAYNLYLIKHNVLLQDRLVQRLKDINNFQGAYYELIIANCLLRAGLAKQPLFCKFILPV